MEFEGVSRLFRGFYFITFLLSKDKKKIYLLTNGTILYMIDGFDKNKFNVNKLYKVNNEYIYYTGIALFPNGKKIVFADAYGINSGFKKEKSVLYPLDYNFRGILFKNDNILFADGYIIELNK